MAKAVEISVEDKLKTLYTVQMIDTQIDKLRAVRGELPMEVKDLEDEIEGLKTRQLNIQNGLTEIDEREANLKLRIKESQKLLKKYEEQQMKVKNNREYEAINKEIEVEGLEIQASEKKIKQAGFERTEKNKALETIAEEIENRGKDLKLKQKELKNILEESQIEEDKLIKKRDKAAENVDERLKIAYNRIRENYRNGIAVATIDRDSCSGCFSQIPPQRQLDIKQHKKIIVCENCGRIIIDNSLAEEMKETQTA
jgi:predicted  nucleic acid-binding Zn-ribbon protein